ncbi:MEDS domain-containing protein [Actinomadura yumaensis]|uniref:MEDS domain-containing protein n=1 Tax=Actinomadura yumaensis TaxID=111807 RepID=A0ABW2D164_9ACTN
MEPTWFAKRPVSDVRPGDHGWLAYAGPGERDRVIGTFVRDGLHTNEKVVYVTDAPAEGLPGLCRLDLDGPRRSGQLRVLPRRAACLDRRGRFEPAMLLDTLGREVDAAFGEGFREVRLTTDFTWLLNEPGRSRLTEMLGCEHGLGEAVSPSTMAKAICQVDRNACPRDELVALRNAHEVLVEVDPEFDDGILRIIRTFDPAGLRVEGELDAARHAVFAEELTKASGDRGPVHLDLSRLGFIDLGGLNLLAHHATELPEEDALVLDNLPPDVEVVIEMVGWHRLPGLSRGRTGGVA